MIFDPIQAIMKNSDDDFNPSHLPADGGSRNWSPIIARIAFLILTIALLVGVFFLIRNFLHAIILGILGATMLAPVHKRVLRLVRRLARKLRRRRKKTPAAWLCDRRSYTRRAQRGHRRAAALATVVGVFCVIAIPAGFFSFTVARQGRKTLSSSLRWIQSGDMERQFRAFSQKYDLQSKWEKVVALTQLTWQPQPDTNTTDGQPDTSPNHVPNTNSLSNTKQDSGTPNNPPKNETESAAAAAPASAHDGADDKAIEDANAAPQPPPDLGQAVVTLSRRVVTVIMDSILKILARTWVLVLNFFIMLFVMFYAFQDGKTFIGYLRRISPLGDAEQVLVLNRIRDVA
ncbi:MAG: hypothetical protein PHC30_03060, partial [Lentisphaeria bacterium]|nr:hypothetical protein [Lentisphaeria bacterium]